MILWNVSHFHRIAEIFVVNDEVPQTLHVVCS
jgi:hypothetical protein